MKIKDLANLIHGDFTGDGEVEIMGLSGIETAKSGDLTFAMDEARLASAEKSAASCVLTGKTLRASSKTLIRVSNPKLSFLVIYNTLNTPEDRESFIHPLATVSNSVKLGKNVWIGANVCIDDCTTIGDHVIIENNVSIKKNCRLGSFCRLYPNVSLYDNTQLGKNVILHSGAVIGADGFGYVKEGGKIYKFPQLGRVIIEDDVEIGANTTIDRGSLSDTVIGAGSKIDNLCQIAHNVKLGKNSIIAAQCGISGSTTIGDNVLMGGQVGVVDNIQIGDNVTVAAQSAVSKNTPSDCIVYGSPARPINQGKKQVATLSWLTKNFKDLTKLLKAPKI